MQRIFQLTPFILLAFSVGCTSDFGVQLRPLGSYSTLFSEADTRMIVAAPTRIDAYGKNVPLQITCAEPSPDVAKAINTAFGAGSAITVNINGAPGTPAQVGEAAAAISKSRAEAIAQLGERMASIQLLRDGLFRACEAFQNGALSPNSYALVLSRYGDTMVTMLGAELIAGEFGRTGASTSGTANATSSAAIAQQATDAAKSANAAVVTAQANLDKANQSLQQAQAATPPDPAAVANGSKAVTDAQNQLASAQRTAEAANDTAKSATASAAATATGTGIGGLNRTPADETAQRIADLVRGYISTPNIQSIMTACISTLEDNTRANTNLGAFCRQSMSGFALALSTGYEKSINGLAAATDDRQLADRIRRLQRVLTTVKTTVSPPAQPSTPH